jgi:glycosyltransferase involved in cell wall biosynthesis
LKIAYVGDIINNGKYLPTIGSGIVLLLSKMEGVDRIDVYSPSMNDRTEEFHPPENVKILAAYIYDQPLSILKLLKVKWKEYDIILFNLLPTAFGNGSLSNVIGLLIAPLINIAVGKEKVRVLYHNSVFTNDIRKLGYDSLYNRVRSIFLSILERLIFKSARTYVLLEHYKDKIDNAIGKNKVSFLSGKYLEVIATLYLNDAMNCSKMERKPGDIPIVLMHGAWGPQKNIEMGLSALSNIKKMGFEFKLVISGGINQHFPEYESYFKALLTKYSDIIWEYLGSVPEKKIMDLFLDADLLILPYNTPGGHSGVLEQAIFFEVPSVCINFPEYLEQTSSMSHIILSDKENFSKSIIENLILPREPKKLMISEKIRNAMENAKKILER